MPQLRKIVLACFFLVAGFQAQSRAQETIPFVPSPMPVVLRMLEVAEFKNGDVLYDMGASLSKRQKNTACAASVSISILN